jgi:PAS domain S-box-containing protein
MSARILIAEDEVILAKDLEYRLTDAGYQVAGKTRSGETTVEKAIETRPDLVLMDITLEGHIDGVEAARLILNEMDTAIIYLTAHTTTDVFDRAKLTDPHAYLTKPISPSELERAIDTALTRHGLMKKLKESERRHRTIFEEALNPILIVDKTGRYVDANRAALEFLEMDKEELLTKVVWDFAPPDQVESQKLEHEPFVSRRTLETDYYINGRIKTLLLNVAPLETNGETRLYGIGQDITERKAMENRLKESEEKYRLLFSNEATPVIVWDADTTMIVDVNEAAQRLYGYSQNHMRSMRATDLDASRDDPGALHNDPDTLGSSSQCVRKHRRADGAIMEVEVVCGAFTCRSQRYVCAIVRETATIA